MRMMQGMHKNMLTALVLISSLLIWTGGVGAQSDPTYDTTIGIGGGTQPVAVAEADGFIYVVDSANDVVRVYETATNNFVNQYGGTGSASGQFDNPTDVVIDDNGLVYIADSGNGRIQVFLPEGSFPLGFAIFREFGSSDVTEPIALDVGPNDYLYVLDATDVEIDVFDTSTVTNTLVPLMATRTFGVAGSANGQFNNPTDLAVDNAGRVYVLDGGNTRVQVFERFEAGNLYLTQFAVSDGFGIEINQRNTIYVSRQGSADEIAVFASGAAATPFNNLGALGAPTDGLNDPQRLAFASDGDALFVADTGDEQVERYDSTLVGCYISADSTAVDELATVTIDIVCAPDVIGVFGIQADTGQTGGVPTLTQAGGFTAGDFITDVSPDVLENDLGNAAYAVTRRSPAPAADGPFTLGSFAFDTPDVTIGDLNVVEIGFEDLALSDVLGTPINVPGTNATITIFDIVDAILQGARVQSDGVMANVINVTLTVSVPAVSPTDVQSFGPSNAPGSLIDFAYVVQALSAATDVSIQASMDNHLACDDVFTVVTGVNEIIATLEAGEVVANGTIDIDDALQIGGVFGTSNASGDVTEDGFVDILDLVNVGRNLGVTGTPCGF